MNCRKPRIALRRGLPDLTGVEGRLLVILLTGIKLRADSVLADPQAAGEPRLPSEQRRLAEVPGELLRVERMPCFLAVDIQRLDAVKLHGPHAVRKDIGFA
jgi:hypothetical protein